MKPYTDEQIGVVENRVRRTAHPRQRAFVLDPARRCSCLVSRGGGKTIGMLLRLILRMVRKPDQNCLFIAATRESAERLVWRDMKRAIDSLRLAGPVFNESKLTLTLPNGSRLLLCGCDDKNDINKLRGITYHEVGIDETGSIKTPLLEELLLEVLGPRLVGSLSLIGTPGKQLLGMFFDATAPGSPHHTPWEERDNPDYAGRAWSSHRWTIKDGVDAGIAALEEIYKVQLKDKADNAWSDDNPRWRREYLGEWAADDTTNVYLYKPDTNRWDPKMVDGFVVLPDDLKDVAYAIGMDVGFKDVFALEVFAFSYTDPRRTLWHVHEVYRTRQYANSVAKMLIGEGLNHDRYEGIIGRIGWPDVMVGDFANAGGALLTELATVYGITVNEAAKHYRYKENSIELLNSMFHDGQVKVMKGSKLEQELTSLQWVVDQYGKRAENKAQANHGTDALLYLRDAVASLLPSAGSEPPPSTPTKRTARPVDDDVVPTEQPDEYGDRDAMYAPGNW